VTHDEDICALRRSLRDPAAFDVLFACHHVAVRRYLYARLGNAAVAEDLAAETFASAFAARARFRDQGQGMRAWLVALATNLLCDELRCPRASRAGGRAGARAREIALGAGSAAPPDLPTDPELAVQLRALPRAQLEVLLLYAWADLSYAEIAVPRGAPRSPRTPASPRVSSPRSPSCASRKPISTAARWPEGAAGAQPARDRRHPHRRDPRHPADHSIRGIQANLGTIWFDAAGVPHRPPQNTRDGCR
jgi:RNA polymerase sigma-70 factor (ECF subfamily)